MAAKAITDFKTIDLTHMTLFGSFLNKVPLGIPVGPNVGALVSLFHILKIKALFRLVCTITSLTDLQLQNGNKCVVVDVKPKQSKFRFHPFRAVGGQQQELCRANMRGCANVAYNLREE